MTQKLGGKQGILPAQAQPFGACDGIMRPMSTTYKDEAGVAAMRVACRLASEVLDYLTPLVQPGITTGEIDRLAAAFMVQQGTVSATIGYQPNG